jgi:hypothetical protein
MSKILVVGSLAGNLQKALDKISSMHIKHQFEMCLCTGDLVGSDLKSILEQKISCPIPLYFIQGKYPIEEKTRELLQQSGGYLGPNIVYLGSHGVLQTATGIKIAYLGGTLGYFNDLSMEIFDQHSDIDLLLTFEWPLGVESGSELFKRKSKIVTGQEIISQIVSQIQPRYHFACSNGMFFEREPYRNIKDSLKQTRFVGMGHFGNIQKERWFYAFTLTPSTAISSTTTPCPFLTSGIVKPSQKRAISSDGSFFWNDSATTQFNSNQKQKTKHCTICKVKNCVHLQQRAIPEGYLCRICGNPGHHIKDCPHGYSAGTKKRKKKDNSKCWFCLSNPEIEAHLIINIAQECYIALAKGGLIPHHLLIVPIVHHINSRQVEMMDDPNISTVLQTEISKIKKAVAEIEIKRDRLLVAFEIFGGGDEFEKQTRMHHMHIQVIFVDV